MNIYQYCTPEWLEESAKKYSENKELQEKLKRFSYNTCYRVLADPAWGLDKDIIFGSFFDQGQLKKFAFFSEEAAKGDETDFILAAPPGEWADILRKKEKFIARFMMNKITLEKGEKVDVLRLAPYSAEIVQAMTQVAVQYADEMSPEELERYRQYINTFRSELAI